VFFSEVSGTTPPSDWEGSAPLPFEPGIRIVGSPALGMTFLAFRGSYVYIYIYNIYITWICVLWSFAEVEYASCGDGPRLTTWIETQSGEDSGSRFVLDVETGPGISTGSDERSDWTGTYPYAEPSGEPVGAIKLLSFRVAWLDCWSWIWPPSFEEVGSALFWNIWNLGLRRKTHTHRFTNLVGLLGFV
jgi:hypothetical protein